MALTFSPRKQFETFQEDHKQFSAMVRSDAFQHAAAMAMAELATTKPMPSQEHLEGAKRFLNCLLELTEKEEPRRMPPVKTLQPPS